MNGWEQIITTQLNVLRENEIGHVFLVTDRALNLRTGPSVDHEVIEVLPRNQKVMELERNHDWLKIEYFDYIANKSKTGWAHSRYLLVIDSGSEE